MMRTSHEDEDHDDDDDPQHACIANTGLPNFDTLLLYSSGLSVKETLLQAHIDGRRPFRHLELWRKPVQGTGIPKHCYNMSWALLNLLVLGPVEVLSYVCNDHFCLHLQSSNTAFSSNPLLPASGSSPNQIMAARTLRAPCLAVIAYISFAALQLACSSRSLLVLFSVFLHVPLLCPCFLSFSTCVF